jgi:hypothetical protein
VDHVHVGVDGGERLLGRVDLALADAVHVVQDLSLEVGRVDDVHVDDPEGAHTGGGQVERGRGTEPARSEQEHLRVEQLELAGFADLGEEQVALVAVALVGRQGLGRRPRTALVLPPVEAPDERDRVLVAELGHGVGGEGRPDAAGAVDDHRGVLVGQLSLDLELQVAPG